jgi:hypothetical protein
MGDLKSGEVFTDKVFVQSRTTLLPATGLAITCTVIDESGTRTVRDVVELGYGWYSCTFTPDADGIWATEWTKDSHYLIWIAYKIFKVGGGKLADLYTDTQNLITLVNTIDEVVDAIEEGQTDLENVLLTLHATVEEVERHIHNYERWFGSTGGVAPAVLTSFVPFTVVSSVTAGQFGTPIAVLDGTETPAQTGRLFFDLHRLQIYDVETSNVAWKVRIADNSGGHTNYADAVAAGRYTEFMVRLTTGANQAQPIPLIQKRLAAGSKIWIAVAKETADATYFKFFIGIHEYVD